MDFIPFESAPPVMKSWLVRTVLAAIALGCLVFGAATMLPRPIQAAPSAPVTTFRVQTRTEGLVEHAASAGEDIGPGCAESEVAKLPEAQQ
jgi:hypothetical protein